MNSFTYKAPKVGLALSGGAVRGVAHIGVLKALEEESIPVDMIAGTSAGAFVGACYAKEGTVALLQETMLGVDWRKLARLADLNLISLGKGFIHGEKVKSILRLCIGDVEFEDLKIPFAVVAADAESMEEIVINKGSVVEAVRASISMPVIFTPVKWGDRFLIDGGVVNPLPVDIVRAMGAEIVIAVNVLAIGQPKKREKLPKERDKMRPAPSGESVHVSAVNKKIDNLLRENKGSTLLFDELSRVAKDKIYTGRGRIDRRTPSIFNVLGQVIHAMEYEKMRLALKGTDIVISPDVADIGTFGFQNREEAIKRGYRATRDILPQLRRMLRCSKDAGGKLAQNYQRVT
jgi:NTE family protein